MSEPNHWSNCRKITRQGACDCGADDMAEKARRADVLPIITVNGDGECTQVEHHGKVFWKLSKPTAPHLRQRIAELESLLAEVGITCHLPGKL